MLMNYLAFLFLGVFVLFAIVLFVLGILDRRDLQREQTREEDES